MYDAKPANRKTEEEAIAICGKEFIESLKEQNCEFTGRLIDEVYGVQEMSASDETETHEVTIHYLISNEDCQLEDMGDADYSNYCFEIWEK